MKQLPGTVHSSAQVLPCLCLCCVHPVVSDTVFANGSDPALSHILMPLRNRKLRCEVKNGTESFHQAILPELRKDFR